MRVLPAVVLTACALLAASVATARTYEPLSIAIQGSGVVHLSNGYEIGCTARSCGGSATFSLPPNVTMTATPAHGWKLVGWNGACNGTAPVCTLSGRGPWHASVTFALPTRAKLGTRSDPVPLGKPFAIGAGWQLTVVSAIPDDTQTPLAGNNTAPPAGAQDFLASVKATYTGGGSASVGDVNLDAIGVDNYTYDAAAYSCGIILPSPALERSQPLFSGQSVTGNVCWQVASNDAASLKLDAHTSRVVGSGFTQSTWFALR